MIALVPCRTGSQRVPKKNFKPLAGKPLLLYTYEAAAESGVFDAIAFCSDDSTAVLKLVKPRSGPSLHFLTQPHPLHGNECWDISWVKDALRRLPPCEEFAILRPTSPFRDAETIKRAKKQWDDIKENYDSMRAITPTPAHPMKTWSYDPETKELWALMKAGHHNHAHSRPTQTLGDFYAQTAALEMAHTKTPLELGTIAGDRIAGFLTCGPEAFDLNTPEDWEYAEYLVSQGKVCRG